MAKVSETTVSVVLSNNESIAIAKETKRQGSGSSEAAWLP